jgi:hypothetical protein
MHSFPLFKAGLSEISPLKPKHRKRVIIITDWTWTFNKAHIFIKEGKHAYGRGHHHLKSKKSLET